MDFTILVNFALLAKFGSLVAGKLIVRPHNTDAKVGQSTYFNCSTNQTSTAIFWYYGTQHVYTGTILHPYMERFTVDRNEFNGTNISNLVIQSVQPGDAGEYSCVEDEGVGEKYSVQLVVLDGDPICRSNIELDEVVGQNTCGVEPDEVELTCSVPYHGNIPPQLEWKRSGYEKPISEGLSDVMSSNHYDNMLKLKGDISLDKSSYVCQATRIVHEPRMCISEVINVLYAIGGNSTVNTTINDEIHCSAFTSQNCSYDWKWWQDNDFTIESSTSLLKAMKPGWHRCEAQCYLRNNTCNLNVMRAFMQSETKSSQAILISSVVLIAVFALVVACVPIFVRNCRRTEIIGGLQEFPPESVLQEELQANVITRAQNRRIKVDEGSDARKKIQLIQGIEERMDDIGRGSDARRNIQAIEERMDDIETVSISYSDASSQTDMYLDFQYVARPIEGSDARKIQAIGVRMSDIKEPQVE